MSDDPTVTPAGSDSLEPAPKRWPRWLPVAIAAAVAAIIVVIAVVASGGDDATTGGTTISGSQSTVPNGSTPNSEGSTPSATTAPSSTPTSGPVDTAGASTTGAATTTSAATATTSAAASTSAEATTTPPTTPPPGVDLGPAANFAVLGNASVDSAGSTVVTGQIGASNGQVTGFSAEGNPAGMIIVDSQTATQAQLGVDNAMSKIDAMDKTALPDPNLSNETIGPGTYGVNTLGVSGTVTLDAGGDANAVFIFSSSQSLIVAAASQIVLEGGAQACNVFWRIGTSVTLGSGVTFVGTVIADDSIGAANGSDVVGRLLASGGSVLLDNASVAIPTCG